MKEYNIPVTWMTVKTFTAQAETLEEAVTEALKQFFAIRDDNYIEDSFEVDSIIYNNYPDEEIDFAKIYKNL